MNTAPEECTTPERNMFDPVPSARGRAPRRAQLDPPLSPRSRTRRGRRPGIPPAPRARRPLPRPRSSAASSRPRACAHHPPTPRVDNPAAKLYGAPMLRFTRHGFREMLIGAVAFALVCTALGFTQWWYLALI